MMPSVFQNRTESKERKKGFSSVALTSLKLILVSFKAASAPCPPCLVKFLVKEGITE